MLRSMYSGVSGLRSHQVYLDTVGNNIANVNTAGYKSGQVVFQDLLSQTMNGAGRPTEVYGGTNPYQVGLGTTIAGVQKNFTQGSAQDTGRTTDMMIQGDGFFITKKVEGGGNFYTRAGSLSLDANGRFVTPTGAMLQGWQATPNPAAPGGFEVNPNRPPETVQIPLGQIQPPNATTRVKIAGNLDATAKQDDVQTTSTYVYDQSGGRLELQLEWKKAAAANQWTLQAKTTAGANVGAAATFTFTNGRLPNGEQKLTIPQAALGGLGGTFTAPIDIILKESNEDVDTIVQYAGESATNVRSQNGYTMGMLRSFNVAANGDINGVFSNGTRRVMGKVALATFQNPDGLERIGETSFAPTGNSGEPQIVVPGEGNAGTIKGGSVEMSNVDLSQEFTNMISAQRGFQANSRIITASDEILQDLVNMKR
ncbi:flagellar hook protein FlgE [Stomatohabitans albus]|uniref:flagellar hook protein FlgE n=1 Tax=Stomatohabitans albus TaxID=3110766 RepID=UPI00300C57A3